MTKNQFFPDLVIHPGESLKEVLEDRGMTQAELANRMGRPLKTLNEIINGKAQITAETAIQLENVLAIPAKFWMNLQMNCNEDIARLCEKERLAKQLEWLKSIPLKAMVRNGWIEKEKVPIDQLKVLLQYFAVANLEGWERIWLPKISQGSIAFRKSNKFEVSDMALATWIRQGEISAETIQCRDFNAHLLKEKLPEIRRLTFKEPEVFTKRLVEIGQECGVAFVFVKELPKLPVCGVTYWLSTNKAIVQLTIRQKAEDQLWFSIFHEIGHILRHGKRDFYLDNEEWEEEANDFARNKLIPLQQYQVFVNKGVFSAKEVEYFAELVGISAGIVVGRLQHDRIIPFNSLNNLKRKVEWA